MNISAVIVSSSKGSIIRDAVESVRSLVDNYVVVDLGITDDTLDIVKSMEKDVVIVPDSMIRDVADWRNIGLRNAPDGFAFMLDTDERLLSSAVDIRAILEANPDIDVWSIDHISGTYSKEKFFRIPTKGYFQANTHEEWIGPISSKLDGVFFDELPKPPEYIKARLPIMLRDMQRQILQEPLKHRWHFYKALYLYEMNQPREAIMELRECLHLEESPMGHAFDCYLLAKYSFELHEYKDCLFYCLQGLKFHPGLAECSWMAGVCCLRQGQAQEALCWANMAIANGLAVGSSVARARLGRKEPYALWEGPFELQRDAMKVLGCPEEALEEIEKQIAQVLTRNNR
jgi:glycosyltransferase involved in cell wall biosynthesis